MRLHSWSRHHTPDLVAQVDPGDDARWIVSIWQGATCVETLRRRFQLLTDAHARADARLCELFPHACAESKCGRWTGGPVVVTKWAIGSPTAATMTAGRVRAAVGTWRPPRESAA
jgi:hypothetical protein